MHSWLFSFVFQSFVKILLQKTALIITFKKYRQSEVFRGKKQKCCLVNIIFLQPCMAGEFSPITKEVASRKKICKSDLFYQNKRDHQLFLQIFSHVFEKQHKMRRFESSFGCTFGCTKGCTFNSYGYSKRIFRGFL